MIVEERLKPETLEKLLAILFEFIRDNQKVSDQFDADNINLPVKSMSHLDFGVLLANYFLEEKLNDGKEIFEILNEEKGPLTEEQVKLLQALKDCKDNIYQVKKITKDCFEFYNMINEKSYKVLPVTRMRNYKYIAREQYLCAKIFKYNDNYYLYSLSKLIPSNERKQALSEVMSVLMVSPELIYKDNEQKLHEIEELLKDMGDKFEQFFNSEEIITTSQNIDEVLNQFNEFIDSGEKADISEYLAEPDNYKYFPIKDNSAGGDISGIVGKKFADNDQVYDIGVLYDREYGLTVLPFYATFKKIFEIDEYKSIDGYKSCVKSYLTSDKIPPGPVLKVYTQNPTIFKNIANEVLENSELQEIDDILKKYKKKFYDSRLFSSTTVLYASKTFNDLMELPPTKEIDKSVGRNEPCPCGSGKKYKKCCLMD